jgi:hypothetical protein
LRKNSVKFRKLPSQWIFIVGEKAFEIRSITHMNSTKIQTLQRRLISKTRRSRWKGVIIVQKKSCTKRSRKFTNNLDLKLLKSSSGKEAIKVKVKSKTLASEYVSFTLINTNTKWGVSQRSSRFWNIMITKR